MGLALTALGIGETVFLGLAGRYQQALAQPARRKLALLVGINQYPEQVVDSTAQDLALKGALTDVELQRELLLDRFGFAPADIVTLTGPQATRQRFLDTIEHHLQQQAKDGDLVVLHFSGYGSQVQVVNQPEGLQRSLVMVDSQLPTESHPLLTDLLEAELVQALQAIPTRQVTAFLDAGHRDLGRTRWGTLRVRSRPVTPTGTLSDERLAALSALSALANWPGSLIRAASPDRLVLEGDWSGFSAGMFTYALTQTLWQVLPPTTLRMVINRSTATLQQWTGPDQQPELVDNHRGESPLTGIYGLPQHLPADGAVTHVDVGSRTVTLWLGGLAPTVLEHLQPTSRLQVELAATGSSDASKSAHAPGEIVLQSRNGLTATARLVDPEAPLPQPGQPLYERVRVLPRDIDLVVALDAELERIERVDATSALSGIPFVSSTIAGVQPADCLFGRLPRVPASTLTAALPSTPGTNNVALNIGQDKKLAYEHSYGLFAPNRTLLPGTLITKDEAVKTAVSRLTPHLQMLLAVKLLRLTSNQQSSQVAVRVGLETTRPQERLLLQQETARAVPSLPSSRVAKLMQADNPSIQISPDSRLRYRIGNYSDRPLYFIVLRFDSRGDFLAWVPENLADPANLGQAAESVMLAAGEQRVVPDDPLDWGVPATVTWVETFLSFSTQPLIHTWQALWGESGETTRQPSLKKLPKPLKVVRALLADLDAAAIDLDASLETPDQYALHTSTWATLGFRYPVI